MAKINYSVAGMIPGSISWEASENFNELNGLTLELGATKAVDIEKMEGLSVRSKILLSAVAGALIQFLLDHHISTISIFETGVFWISQD